MSKSVKKLIAFTSQEWSEIEDYRFLNRIDKQTEAVKELINFGKLYRKNLVDKAIDKTFEKYSKVYKNLAKR